MIRPHFLYRRLGHIVLIFIDFVLTVATLSYSTFMLLLGKAREGRKEGRKKERKKEREKERKKRKKE